jgi:ABC-type sugar transport system ATPase subunit
MDTAVRLAAGAGGGSSSRPALRATGVAKTFPGVRALRGVDVVIERGEVRGLVGANGSGKSTFIKIVAGAIAPDDGSVIEIAGQTLEASRPWEARALGVATIYQELTIVPTLSAVDNAFLGDYKSRGPFVARRRMDAEFRRLCARLAVSLHPRTPAAAMSVADLTILEIIRAIRLDARLLIFDEATATLGPRERERIYALIGVLASQGVGVIFVSHDLNEIQQVCHTTTVFRDGAHVRTAERADWSHDALVRAMLGARGRTAAGAVATERIRVVEPERTALSARGVVVPGVIEHVDLDVAHGEIVGIAGLVGSGRSTLLKALAGAVPFAGGELALNGRPVAWPKNIPAALKLGVALLPEDRAREGLVLSLPTFDNVTLTRLGRAARRGIWLTRRESTNQAGALLRQVDFRGQIGVPTGTLSGGNQQKALFAKWLYFGPQVYLIDEPTRGVDIGAKREMLDLIRRSADEGNAFVVVSSEFEELEAVCDHILVIANGRIVKDLRGEDMHQDAIYDALFAPGSDIGATTVQESL